MSQNQSKTRQWLGKGLEAQQARMASATLYERSGPLRSRETGAGMTAFVRPLLDARLDLTPAQRATGQTFGAYYEQCATGGSSEFLREFVDGGGSGGGGHSERLAMMAAQVDVAMAALQAMPPVTYKLSKPRPGAGQRGNHAPISCQVMMLEACVNGHTMTAVALTYGWWVERKKKPAKGKGKHKRTDLAPQPALVVPDRQRKHLAESLRECLEAVADAWEQRGYGALYEFGTVEPE